MEYIHNPWAIICAMASIRREAQMRELINNYFPYAKYSRDIFPMKEIRDVYAYFSNSNFIRKNKKSRLEKKIIKLL